MLLNMINNGFEPQNLDTINTSVVVQNVKKTVSHVSWESSCANITNLYMLWRNVEAIT